MAFLVKKNAPGFVAPAVLADGSVDKEFALDTLRGQYIILLFYPLDFTVVCPTEVLAFSKRYQEFEDRECTVVGISVDSEYVHLAWRRTPEEQGGVGPIHFPLVSDMKRTIAESYGVLLDDATALRGLFLIDREGVIRHAIVNDQPFGRSVDEALRMVDALRFHDEHGELCPANWEKGKEGAKAKGLGAIDRLSKYAGKKSDSAK